MCQGSSHFSGFLHHFVLAKVATNSMRVKQNMTLKVEKTAEQSESNTCLQGHRIIDQHKIMNVKLTISTIVCCKEEYIARPD